MNLRLALFVIFTAFFSVLCSKGFAQGGNNIWYFGHNAGLDFTTAPPSAIYDGALVTEEGCATLTDEQGNLLLYTDELFVYNRLHQQMPNGFGLWGHPSSTQSAIIVPWPDSDSLFYIFTTEDFVQNNRMSYSVVDLSLDNGLGDVITKNVLLQQPVTEQLNAVKHANGTDYWVVAHGMNNNFYVYPVTATGISTAPVINSLGPVMLCLII